MRDIITIGSITRDNFLELDCEIIPWKKTLLKKALVFPLGEKLSVKKVYSALGGNSANAGVTFSRQGFKTACFGKIGDDLAGREIISQLKKEKVQPLFAVSKEKPTAYSVILLKNGERTILGYHGASDTMGLSDIPWNELKSRWWYLSLAGDSYKLLKPLLSFAKKNGIKVAFNPSSYHIRHAGKEILSSLKDVAFLVLNEGEAAELVGIPFSREKEVFKKLDKLMPGIVAVTNGRRGVTVSDGKNIYKAKIFREKKIVDYTGAGDAFGSGFTSALMRGWNIKEAIKLASANATSVIEKIGATEGILKGKDFILDVRWKNLKVSVRKI
ncbi:MAG: carbohydrate kinase family protein [Patescibacteria group bacterium]